MVGISERTVPPFNTPTTRTSSMRGFGSVLGEICTKEEGGVKTERQFTQIDE